MTTPEQTAQNDTSQKELNFRKLEAYYEQKLAQERAEKEEALKKAQEIQNQHSKDEDDDDSDPYVDRKKLEKKLSKFGQNTQSEIQKAMEIAKQKAKEELKQELWLEQNPDFYNTLQLAEKFAHSNPHLAETILKMPDGFERQKLVYQNIKALGIDKPATQSSSIQDTIQKNQKYPGYQPGGFSGQAYQTNGDFSESGKEQAYQKMMQLKASLRLGG